MTVEALDGVPGVHHRHRSGLGGDLPGVADLPAGFRVEGRAVEEDLHLLAVFGHVDELAVPDDGEDPSLGGLELVPHEGGEPGVVEHLPVELRAGRLVAALPLLPCPGTLLLHRRLELVGVDVHPALGGDLLGQLDGESEGVVQLEGGGTA